MHDVVRPALMAGALGFLVIACAGAGDGGGGRGGSGGNGGDTGGNGGGGAGTGGSGGGAMGGSGGAGGAGGMGGGGGAGGMGGAGGSGGSGGGQGGSGGSQDAAAPDGGAGDAAGPTDARVEAGGAAKMAVANIMMINNGTITGKVTFVEVANGVQVTYALENCPPGRHPTHIHAGNGCGMAQQGMHWGPARGENIGPAGGEITCGADMKGTLVYTRMNASAATRWTIGDGAVSDIVGHPVIVHGVMDSDQRHGCGVIQAMP